MQQRNVVKEHPELLTIENDQKILSPVVAAYIEQAKRYSPEGFENLKVFLEHFSQIKHFSDEEVHKLAELPNWTFAPEQKKMLIDQLQRVARNYPVPENLVGHISPGFLVDLSKETNVDGFYRQLDSFAQKVANISREKKNANAQNIDISQIGKLPLRGIQDPLLEGKVGSLWTLDVTENPGLSIKDVMALWMIREARELGQIQPETILVEGTSGNTGAGMAIIAQEYGLKLILVIPDKMSHEKIERLRQLGAHVIVTPTKVDADDPRSYYSVRDYLAMKTQGWRAGQYDNLANREAHQAVTGPEIWEQTGGKVTAVISTAGTCGTISGIGRYLKSKNPEIKMIAVDTIGSILYLLKAGHSLEEVQQYAKGYTIQGFGEDIHPQNLDMDVVDYFLRIGDSTGLNMTRMLPLLGFVPGQSSGAAYAALLESIQQKILGPDDNVVIIFPDVGVPYRHDVYNDNWMRERQFI